MTWIKFARSVYAGIEVGGGPATGELLPVSHPHTEYTPDVY